MAETRDLADPRLADLTRARVSRAAVLRAAALGVGLAAVPSLASAQGTGGPVTISFPFYPPVKGTYSPETIQQIVNNLLTFEYALSTLGVYQIQHASTLNITGLELNVLQATVAEQQYHIDLLSSVPGTAPSTTTFTYPAAAGQRSENLDIAILGALGSSLYLTAVREFAEQGQPTLVEWAYEIGAMYSELRGIGRALDAQAGDAASVPPNNHAFEPEFFLYTSQSIALLQRVGVIAGSGTAVTYQGRAAVLAATGAMLAAVTNTTPSVPTG